VDIPFIRFAFPLIILYFYWNAIVANPWVEETQDANPNALSVAKSQKLLTETKKLVQAGQYREALVPALQLYKAFPENHIYIEQTAKIYDALEQWPDSAQMWEHYLQYAPTPTDGCPMLGFAYENMGQSEEAFKAHERCWQFEQNNSDMIFFYAHGLERHGEYKKAGQLYEQGLKRSPTYPDLLVGLARTEIQTGRFPLARKHLDQVLERSPDNVDALFAKGLMETRLGHVKAAVEALDHAHRMSPGYREAEILLSQLRGPNWRRSE
jgi:tetratricopeptide (TPR) repeat protein